SGRKTFSLLDVVGDIVIVGVDDGQRHLFDRTAAGRRCRRTEVDSDGRRRFALRAAVDGNGDLKIGTPACGRGIIVRDARAADHNAVAEIHRYKVDRAGRIAVAEIHVGGEPAGKRIRHERQADAASLADALIGYAWSNRDGGTVLHAIDGFFPTGGVLAFAVIADREHAQPANASATTLDERGVRGRERRGENFLVAGWRYALRAGASGQDRRGDACRTIRDLRPRRRCTAVEQSDLEAGAV